MSNSTWSKHMEYVAQLEQTLAENGLLDWWRGEQAKSDDGKFKETKRRKIGKKKQHDSLISTTTYDMLKGTSKERSEATKEFNKNNSTEGMLDNQIRYFESWLKGQGFPAKQEECNCWAIGPQGQKYQTRSLQSEVKHLAGDDNPLPVYAVNALVHAQDAKKAYALEDYKHASWNIAKMAEYSHKHTVSRMEEKWRAGNSKTSSAANKKREDANEKQEKAWPIFCALVNEGMSKEDAYAETSARLNKELPDMRPTKPGTVKDWFCNKKVPLHKNKI